MRVTLRRSFDLFLEEWQVTLFKDDHNHKLLSPEQVRFLHTYRSIDKETERWILLLNEAGLSVRQIMHIIELKNNVKHGHLQFLAEDIYNLFWKVSKMMGPNDAMELLKFCKDDKDENPMFQCAFTLVNENKLEHNFWSPTQCFDWCQKFCDVVVFDTT